MLKFNDYLEARKPKPDPSQVALDNYINLYQNPQNTIEYWKAIYQADRQVSQHIQHGAEGKMKEKLLTAFHQVDPWILKNCPFKGL